MKWVKTLQRWAAQIKRDSLTLWFANRHPATPGYARILCLLVVAYALSPIDLIPDFIPVLGYVDDLLLLPILIRLAVSLLPTEVIVECHKRAEEWQQRQDLKPRSYLGAVMILLIWSGLIYAGVRLIV